MRAAMTRVDRSHWHGFVHLPRVSRSQRNELTSQLTEKVKKCSISVSNQEKCAVGVHLLCSDTYQAPQGTSF